jgi:heterotetrameric sarcosine oxidase gamma subunit
MSAVMAEYRGWQVASQFTSPEQEARQVRETAGLADWSWMSKFDLKGCGLKTTPQIEAGADLWPLAPCHYLATSENTDREEILGKLAFLCSAETPTCLTDVTSAYAALLLAGPHSRDILQKLTTLNVSDESLPDGACAQASLSHVHAIFLRRDVGAMPAFTLLVSREYAEYVWDSVMHAGHACRITPFGTACRSLLGGLSK